jgi:hypothetical protein
VTTLEQSFEADLREATLDAVQSEVAGQQANLVFQFVELVHARLRAYATRHNYDVESTIDSLAVPEVDRTDNSLSVTVGWESEQMARWEFGTSEHTIDGDPVLSFVWAETDTPADDPPQWVREEFDQARDAEGQFRSGWRVFLPEVTVAGIPESRAIRDAINGLRQVLKS